MKLGPCINTADFIADITDVGGATGTWNGASGTFTVQIAATADCGGSGDNYQLSAVSLTINGSGTIDLTFSGTGSNVDGTYVTAFAYLGTPLEVFEYESNPDGGINYCSGSTMIEVKNDFPITVCCGTLQLVVYLLDGPAGDWTCTFNVSAS